MNFGIYFIQIAKNMADICSKIFFIKKIRTKIIFYK